MDRTSGSPVWGLRPYILMVTPPPDSISPHRLCLGGLTYIDRHPGYIAFIYLLRFFKSELLALVHAPLAVIFHLYHTKDISPLNIVRKQRQS